MHPISWSVLCCCCCCCLCFLLLYGSQSIPIICNYIQNVRYRFTHTVETIIESEKKAEPETHILKSDGTTAKIRPKKVKEMNAGRQLTSQEESILMPLIQGLLSANGCDSPLLMHTKHENTPFGDVDTVIANAKNGNAGQVETELSEYSIFRVIFFGDFESFARVWQILRDFP